MKVQHLSTQNKNIEQGDIVNDKHLETNLLCPIVMSLQYLIWFRKAKKTKPFIRVLNQLITVVSPDI